MAGTRRTPLHRRRLPPVAADALALFMELEGTPKRRRSAQTFKDGERELHRMLGLTSEWWTGNSVLDRSNGPCHPPGYIAHSDWFRVRRIRETLLQAATTCATNSSSHSTAQNPCRRKYSEGGIVRCVISP